MEMLAYCKFYLEDRSKSMLIFFNFSFLPCCFSVKANVLKDGLEPVSNF